MNAQAQRLGMSSTRYINANGLPGKGQYTTARDLALLALIIKREFPNMPIISRWKVSPPARRTTPTSICLLAALMAQMHEDGFICASGFNRCPPPCATAVRS